MHHPADFHFITSIAYAVVGAIFFACAWSARYRHHLLRNENERAAAFSLTGVFIYACFLDHFADSIGADGGVLYWSALFEAVVSVTTAGFLIWQGRPWRA